MVFRFPRLKYGASDAPFKAAVHKHPFLLFGLPFITMIAGASFLVTPMTATRYDVNDRKFRKSERQEAIDTTGVKRRKFDAREEYYRLAARDLDNWEQRRIPRGPGEPDRGFDK